jgi:hypothetical protein
MSPVKLILPVETIAAPVIVPVDKIAGDLTPAKFEYV